MSEAVRVSEAGILAGPSIGRLLSRVGQGDTVAFEQLCDTLGPLVLLATRGVLGQQAEQVAENVLAEIWRTAPSFDEADTSAVTWVCAIANRAVAGIEPLPGSDQVRETLRALSQGQWQCIRLAVRDGKTYQQIAARLNLPKPIVIAHLRDGMIGLSALLALAARPPVAEPAT